MTAYTILSFNRENGTMEIAFPGQTTYNYNAPRLNGVYLSGIELENYIQSLHPLFLPNPEIEPDRYNEILLSWVALSAEDPASTTGGEEIQAKYQAYLNTL